MPKLKWDLSAIKKGEKVFLTWPDAPDRISEARELAKEIRAKGATLSGCSFDVHTKKTQTCMVCGQKGLLRP